MPAQAIETGVVQPPRWPAVSDCIRCGLCLESCPTYAELGLEAESPRGRIALMRALDERRILPTAAARGHLDLCLDCRACETACPSGVRYGTLIERVRVRAAATRPRRGALQWLRDYLLFHVVTDRRRLRRWAAAWRFLEACGLGEFVRMATAEPNAGLALPPLPEATGVEWPEERTIPDGGGRGRAWMFLGCVSAVLAPRTNRATVRLLVSGGLETLCPAAQGCCGAVHYHAGQAAAARELARRNIDAFGGGGDEPIVVNVAGCGAMLRAYGRLLEEDREYAGRAARFSDRVRDVSEVVQGLVLPVARVRRLRRVAYHDACHLCHAQGIRRQPREMLRRIAGVELVPLAESEMCCGAAGAYSLMQPAMAGRLARRKWRNIRASGADAVATGNIGCILQLVQHRPEDLAHVEVVHPVDLLSEALNRQSAESPER